MSLITPKTNPAQTIVYSKNGCVKCNQTKTLLKRNNIPFLEVNIEESGKMDEYIAFLKESSELPSMSMPVVFPLSESGMEMWCDFQPNKIKELKSLLEIN